MSISKEERDQWRERLLSPYTRFDAAHADFTIRLLDALEAAEEDRRRLEREADWLAHGYTNALEWTDEPQFGAWNWWRDGRDEYSGIIMLIARVPYQDLGGQWAGPIPEPREPK